MQLYPNDINAFIITAKWEEARKTNVDALKKILPSLEEVAAIYPKHQKVPFIDSLQQKSKQRTGRALNAGEIGVLLSNRKIWRKIVATAPDDYTHYLILESDSIINNLSALCINYSYVSRQYDIFFWGGWLGHIKLKKSTFTVDETGNIFGEPVWKTICSAYGYSINRNAAKLLLEYTRRISYPVDEFKRYLPKGICKMGAVQPEIISELPGSSTIGHNEFNSLLEKCKMLILDCRNSILAYFS